MIEAGRLTKAVPMKDAAGVMTTKVIEQEGPIAFVETTTLNTIFDEDANRCLLLSIDEREEQTRPDSGRDRGGCRGLQPPGPGTGEVGPPCSPPNDSPR